MMVNDVVIVNMNSNEQMSTQLLPITFEHSVQIENLLKQLNDLKEHPTSKLNLFNCSVILQSVIQSTNLSPTSIMSLYDEFAKITTSTRTNLFEEKVLTEATNGLFCPKEMGFYSVTRDSNVLNNIVINAVNLATAFGPKFCPEIYNNNRLPLNITDDQLSKCDDKVAIINSIFLSVSKFIEENQFKLVRVKWFLSNLFTDQSIMDVHCQYSHYIFNMKVYTYTPNRPEYYSIRVTNVNALAVRENDASNKNIVYEHGSPRNVDIGIIYTTFPKLVKVNPLIFYYFKILLNSESYASYKNKFVWSKLNILSDILTENEIPHKIIKEYEVANLNISSIKNYCKVDVSGQTLSIIPYIDEDVELSIMFWHGYNYTLLHQDGGKSIHHKCKFDVSTFMQKYRLYEKFMFGEYEYSTIYENYLSYGTASLNSGIRNMAFKNTKTNLFNGHIIKTKKNIINDEGDEYIWKIKLSLRYNPSISQDIILTINGYFIKKLDVFLGAVTQSFSNDYKIIPTIKIEGSLNYCNSVICRINKGLY